MLAIHTTVLPLDGQRALVVDAVQGADDFFEVYVAPAQRAKVPVAPTVSEVQMAAKHARLGRGERPADVFHVDVENAVAETIEEFDVIHALVPQMAGVVVEAECRMAVDGLDGPLR